MNKIAQYLNEHILGELTSSEPIRKNFSRDGSILSITPEIVVHPRVTNDIRKVARFTWQLAEKGHVMPMTVRGSGSDQTGAAIGKGIIINTLAHLNKVIYISLKNKDQFVHVQPGTNFDTLNNALQANGLMISSAPTSSSYSTIGGAVANNTSGPLSGRYGTTGSYVTRLEVVLANGDLIETSRINKRELSKKKGLQTFEGELYRKIDAIIDDNQQTINDKIAGYDDNAGYPGIAKVKNRDGSFDLTPLFIGSQGTLGVISEIVLRPDFYNNNESVIVASFSNPKIARDAAALLSPIQPDILEIIDGKLFEIATATGKKYPFLGDEQNDIGSILFVSYNGASERNVHRSVKRTIKKLSKLDTTIYTSDNYSIEELKAIREVSSVITQSTSKEGSVLPIVSGSSIPTTRIEEFIAAKDDFSKKHHVEMPMRFNWLNGVIHVYPKLNLHVVSDKQKAFKLITEYLELIMKCGGNMMAESSEGRLKASAAYKQLDQETLDIYTQIRAAFDPFGTLNPGVKQESDISTLISHLNPSYDLADFAKYTPTL